MCCLLCNQINAFMTTPWNTLYVFVYRSSLKKVDSHALTTYLPPNIYVQLFRCKLFTPHCVWGNVSLSTDIPYSHRIENVHQTQTWSRNWVRSSDLTWQNDSPGVFGQGLHDCCDPDDDKRTDQGVEGVPLEPLVTPSRGRSAVWGAADLPYREQKK